MTQKPLAVFDFDHTLVKDDSMWQFFVLLAGWPQTALAFTKAVANFAWLHFVRQENRNPVDRGTFLKQQMLQQLIAGKTLKHCAEAAARLKDTLRWDEKMRATLQDHYDKGHHVVIASGSLDLYLPHLLQGLPHHALLCTEIAVSVDVATDVMSKGNCVRDGKAARVAAYMSENGPFGESWGYGNFPDDVPMMNLMKYRVIV